MTYRIFWAGRGRLVQTRSSMSVLLFVVGAIATVAGVGMVGYGIPINEFSFGNTLIVAGTTLAVGGLVIIAIGAAVSKLQQITEAITARTPRRLELFETPSSNRAAPMQDRIPFPPRTKAAPPRSELPPVETSTAAEVPADENAVASTAPVLRNPDVPLAERREAKEYEELSLSLRQPTAAPGEYAKEQPTLPPAPPVMEKRAGPIDAPLRSPPRGRPHTTSFDAVWPPESRANRSTSTVRSKPSCRRARCASHRSTSSASTSRRIPKAASICVMPPATGTPSICCHSQAIWPKLRFLKVSREFGDLLLVVTGNR